MLQNYLRIAFRNLWKNRLYSTVNVMGLAIGMACCLLILFYVKDELSFDKSYVNAENIFRITERNETDGIVTHAAHAYSALANALVTEFPEVEAVVRFYPNSSLVANGPDLAFQEESFYFADSTVLDIFDLPVVSGDANRALAEPNSLVITESMARKYFGEEEAVNKTLKVNGTTDFNITAVIKDQPSNTHIQFDFLASYINLQTFQGGWMFNSWYWPPMYTYLEINDAKNAAGLQAKFPDMITKYLSEAENAQRSFVLQPLSAIHTESALENEWGSNIDMRYIYILITVAGLILVIACINFMNLATARSMGRASEVGVRKVMGAMRKQLIYQFLGESLLISVFSAALAAIIFVISWPNFQQVAGRAIPFSATDYGYLAMALTTIALFVGVAAGYYPALYLSGFNPISVLKKAISAGKSSTAIFRKALVIFQFFVSTALIVVTLIISEQLSYIRSQNLGFDKEQVMVLEVRDGQARQTLETFKERLLQRSGIVSVAASRSVPGGGRLSDYNIRAEGREEENLMFYTMSVDMDYLKAMNVEVLQGKLFDKNFASDSTGIVMNETAWKKLQWEEPLEKKIDIGFMNQNGAFQSLGQGQVIGVVSDFNYNSLHRAVDPMLMIVSPAIQNQYLSVRIQAGDPSTTIAEIKEDWDLFSPGRPFEFFFLDQEIQKLYEGEERLGKIFLSFSFLAIFIACLGLFALASYMVEQRTKEIGLRKVMGATVSNITLFISKDFAKLVLISIVIAIPLSYWGGGKWLDNFVFKTNIGVDVFLIGAFAAIGIALVTVSFHAIKAAKSNPIDSIRHE